MKDESIQKKDYDIEAVSKLLLLNPLLKLDKKKRKAYRERVANHKDGDLKNEKFIHHSHYDHGFWFWRCR